MSNEEDLVQIKKLTTTIEEAKSCSELKFISTMITKARTELIQIQEQLGTQINYDPIA